MVMIRGKQTIKGGLDYRRDPVHAVPAECRTAATLNFDQGFTRSDYLTQDALSGNGMASMLLGYAQSGSAGFTANPFFQWIYTAPWVQDDIKVYAQIDAESRTAVGHHVAGDGAVQSHEPRLLRRPP